ncbi:hypothetical protein LIA77_05091 [Sarocladium implicatum]|nr:hypothetical protein LIA77_05091 [Sarocladium implicatum]
MGRRPDRRGGCPVQMLRGTAREWLKCRSLAAGSFFERQACLVESRRPPRSTIQPQLDSQRPKIEERSWRGESTRTLLDPQDDEEHQHPLRIRGISRVHLCYGAVHFSLEFSTQGFERTCSLLVKPSLPTHFTVSPTAAEVFVSRSGGILVREEYARCGGQTDALAWSVPLLKDYRSGKALISNRGIAASELLTRPA